MRTAKIRIVLLMSLAFIMQGDIVSQSCLPEGMSFRTQSQIDSFQINFPGCTEIGGDVEIFGNQIYNLLGLRGVASIGGDLRIWNCDSLVTLEGLDSLTIIGNELELRLNDSLECITSLLNVISIGSIRIWGNNSLASLSGLDNIESTDGNLSIDGNKSLTTLDGLQNISSVGHSLLIYANRELLDISSLSNVATVGSSLIISRNFNLPNLVGLDNLNSVGKWIEINFNLLLTNISSLKSVQFIGASLAILNNPQLSTLTGLENVTSIGRHLSIENCNTLSDLSGLQNLTSIDGRLKVLDNKNLISLNGIENIDAPSISLLDISGNPLLSFCEVQSICDYLDSPNGTIAISNNASGCISQGEVEEACMTVGVASINVEFEFSIYPNPATTELLVSSASAVVFNEAILYNQIGQVVLHEDLSPHAIDVSMLPSGIYVVELVSNTSKFRSRVIIL